MTKCYECLAIARELKEALSGELDRRRKQHAAENITHERFVSRLRSMTEDDLLQMSESFSASTLGKARRRVVEHHVLTGHWAPLQPPIGEWTA